MKRIFLISTLFFTIFSSQVAHSQAFTYYPFNSVFAISSNPTKVFWLDFRFQMNSYFTSLSTEISPMINYKTIGVTKLYMGGGARFNFLNFLNDDPAKRNPLEAYFLSFGMRSSPFTKAKGVQIAFELSPDISKNIDLGQFRARIGVAYVFKYSR